MNDFWTSHMQGRWLVVGSGADMRITNQMPPEFVSVPPVKSKKKCSFDQAALKGLFSLLDEQKHGQQWFLSFLLYDIPISPSWGVLIALCPPPATPSCVVSAHWDMLFGLIHNASPAPGHHVWQMTYFCADPHRALTWGVCVCACVRTSVYVCLFVCDSRLAVYVWKWDGEEEMCSVSVCVF